MTSPLTVVCFLSFKINRLYVAMGLHSNKTAVDIKIWYKHW